MRDINRTEVRQDNKIGETEKNETEVVSINRGEERYSKNIGR